MYGTDVLFQVSTCGRYSRLVLFQDELLRAEAVVLHIRRPVKHAWIEIESLQLHSQPNVTEQPASLQL